MTETKTTRQPAATQSPSGPESPQFVHLVVSLGYEARRISKSLIFAAAASLGSAAFIWFGCFSPYVFDSIKSFLACSSVGLCMLAPGVFLIFVRRWVVQLTGLPRKLRDEPTEDQFAQVAEKSMFRDREEDESFWNYWQERIRHRFDRVMELWGAISDFDTALLRAKSARPAISFLLHPASPISVLAALLLSALLLVAGVLYGFWCALAAIF